MPGMAPAQQEYEYTPVRIPPGTDGTSATIQLTLHAEYGGWELARVRVHSDGSRQVWLRRRRTGQSLPGPFL